MLTVLGAGAWLFFAASPDVRTAVRCFTQSTYYKAKFLALPNPIDGQLKHVEWDGWGIAGADNTVYLVFDSDDSLSAAAASHSPGKYQGIPRAVYNVRRLELHWYTGWFYTNTDWDHCSDV